MPEDLFNVIKEPTKRQKQLDKSNTCEILHFVEKSKRPLEPMWRTTINLTWPTEFCVSSVADSLDVSTYQTCLLVAMKLKARHFLNDNNTLEFGKVKSVPNHYFGTNRSPSTEPDITIYVDASSSGFGAYLTTKDSDSIAWISDKWSGHIHQLHPGINIQSYTTYAEFYALVSALYTWRYVCKGRSVQFVTDSMATVKMVNNGLYCIEPSTKKKKKRSRSPYHRLYSILCDTCNQNFITVRAQHVFRAYNAAADMPSKSNQIGIKEHFPKADLLPIKTQDFPILPELPDGSDNQRSSCSIQLP